jgi:adenosylhomocysteine nucleosidase
MAPARRPACLATAVRVLCAAVAAAEDAPIVLLGAFAPETQPVIAGLSGTAACSLPAIPCTSGTLDGRRTIVATTGIGKTNAAMTTAVVIERFAPAAVIFSGVAGGIDPDLQPGDVVIGERLLQHDLVIHSEAATVLRAVRDPAGVVRPTVLDASPALLQLARDVAGRLELEAIAAAARPPRVRIGTIVTGDAFVGSQAKKAELRERFRADAVEMEGAAIAHVCAQRGVPVLVVRGLSDRAAGEAPEEARRHLGVAARNAATAALAIARALAASAGSR